MLLFVHDTCAEPRILAPEAPAPTETVKMVVIHLQSLAEWAAEARHDEFLDVELTARAEVQEHVCTFMIEVAPRCVMIGSESPSGFRRRCTLRRVTTRPSLPQPE